MSETIIIDGVACKVDDTGLDYAVRKLGGDASLRELEQEAKAWRVSHGISGHAKDTTRKVALDKTALDVQKQTDAILQARRALGEPFGALDMALLEGTRVMTDSLPDHLKTSRYPSRITVGSRFRFSKKKSTEYAKDDTRNQVSTTGDLFKYKPKSSVRRAKN